MPFIYIHIISAYLNRRISLHDNEIAEKVREHKQAEGSKASNEGHIFFCLLARLLAWEHVYANMPP